MTWVMTVLHIRTYVPSLKEIHLTVFAVRTLTSGTTKWVCVKKEFGDEVTTNDD